MILKAFEEQKVVKVCSFYSTADIITEPSLNITEHFRKSTLNSVSLKRPLCQVCLQIVVTTHLLELPLSLKMSPLLTLFFFVYFFLFFVSIGLYKNSGFAKSVNQLQKCI